MLNFLFGYTVVTLGFCLRQKLRAMHAADISAVVSN
jgi:hypothetical protein